MAKKHKSFIYHRDKDYNRAQEVIKKVFAIPVSPRKLAYTHSKNGRELMDLFYTKKWNNTTLDKWEEVISLYNQKKQEIANITSASEINGKKRKGRGLGYKKGKTYNT